MLRFGQVMEKKQLVQGGNVESKVLFCLFFFMEKNVSLLIKSSFFKRDLVIITK